MPPTSQLVKKFALGLRKIEIESPYIAIGSNLLPKLSEYIDRLENTRFADNKYHMYCGEIKDILDIFLSFWIEFMNYTVVEADKLEHVTPLRELIDYIEGAIKAHIDRQLDFENMYLPTESPEEEKAYEAVQAKVEPFIEFINGLLEELRNFDLRDSLEDFIKEHIANSVKRNHSIFEFTHIYIAQFLVTKMYEFRVSMEEILKRIKINRHRVLEKRDTKQRKLVQDLYDVHKHKLSISRKDHRNSRNLAEVERTMTKIREQLSNLQTNHPIAHLNEEISYWERRLKEFGKIEKTMVTLMVVNENYYIYEEFKNAVSLEKYTEAMKECCYHNINEQFVARRKFIDDKLLVTSRALVTFFSVPGPNRVFYKDNVGKNTIDDYGHQVYYFDHGSVISHSNCHGEHIQVNDHEQKYVFDEFGRHIYEGEHKVYQCAPCTSSYKLGVDDVLVKQTGDCGHSESKNPKCKMQLKNPNDIELLPSVDPVDIKGTLSKEEVEYLWHALGGNLTKSLKAVGLKRSNNPILHLAQEVLHHKYWISPKEVEASAKEADDYRAGVLNHRKQKALKSYLAWKAKQVKRRKPLGAEEDKAREIHDSLMADYQLVCDMNETNQY